MAASAVKALIKPAWVDELFASIDAQDAEAFAGFLTNDATFTFGNAPGVQGSAAIIAAVGDFFASIKALKHELTLVVSQPDVIVCCGTVTYTRHDDAEVTLPFADTFAIQNDKVSNYQIYMDIGPVYASP